MTTNPTSWLLTFEWAPTRDIDPDRQELILYRLQDASGLLSQQPDGTWHVSVVVSGADFISAVGMASRLVKDATGAANSECRLSDSEGLSEVPVNP